MTTNQSTKNTIKIDPDKFMKWYKAKKAENKINSAEEFTEKIGYNQTFINNCRKRGVMSFSAYKLLEYQYGLKIDDIKPDEKKPEPKKVENSESSENVPQNQIDISKIQKTLDDSLKEQRCIETMVYGFWDDIQKGFRVQTSPRLDTESISEGVYAGISRFWERNKKDILGQLRGLVFAGTFEAGKQLDEMRNNQKNFESK